MLSFIIDGDGFGWHVGELIKRPKITEGADILVQADGHELAWIRENIEGIPIHSTNIVQIWRGDLAAFIIESLPVDYSIK